MLWQRLGTILMNNYTMAKTVNCKENGNVPKVCEMMILGILNSPKVVPTITFDQLHQFGKPLHVKLLLQLRHGKG